MVILHVNDNAKRTGSGVAVVVPKYIMFEKEYANVALYDLNNISETDAYETFFYSDYDCISRLPSPYNKPDLVVFHEVYKKKYLKLYKECLKNNIKYIVVPHGCLTKEAQKMKFIKKMVANFLFFGSFLKNSSCIQFLSIGEKKQSKYNKLNSIISGNGIDLIDFENKPKTPFNFIYIGRYAINHKGIDMLLKACKLNHEWMKKNNIRLDMYGNGIETGAIKNIVREYGIDDVCIINGPVFGKEKSKLLSDSNVFIQTSRLEGQPVGIIEALCCGLPCIVTPGTNFCDYVEEKNVGYICDFDEKSIASCMKESFINRDKLNEKSKNAKINCNKDFNWKSIIKDTMVKYQKLVNNEKVVNISNDKC